MEKIVLKHNKKGYTQTQLETAACAFAKAQKLTEVNFELYHDFEEMGVFGLDEAGKQTEAVLPFSKLDDWLK